MAALLSSLEPEASPVEVSVVMPCLNEARTLPACINKAKRALERLGVAWEIIVADNGSVDGSQQVAESNGARVVGVPRRGYGNAYLGGVEAARGRYIVMGDSDDSYDFEALGPFVDKLRAGADVVMGSRFRGQIMPGAMPWSHRYIGNPVLTGILNLLFRAGISDAHCGLRAVSREAWTKLNLRTGGMEFASEMVIRAAQEHLKIDEIPITLYRDGRDRPPHLRSFRDGWRHLRFMLMFSPLWLFFVPSLLFAVVGLPLLCLVPFARIDLFGHEFSLHFSLLGSTLVLISFQLAQLGIFAKLVFVSEQIGEDRIGRWVLERFRVGRALLSGIMLFAVGSAIDIKILIDWIASEYGGVAPQVTALAILASTLLLIGLQVVFSTFFLAILRGSRTGGWAD